MMRHGKKVQAGTRTLVLDTRTDCDWFVLREEAGEEVARQAKVTTGRRFRQGTNPDYIGYDAFPLEFKEGDRWVTWNDQARKGELLSERFLERITSR